MLCKEESMLWWLFECFWLVDSNLFSLGNYFFFLNNPPPPETYPLPLPAPLPTPARRGRSPIHTPIGTHTAEASAISTMTRRAVIIPSTNTQPISDSGTLLRMKSTIQAKPARSEEQRLNSSHSQISYAVFCLKKKKIKVRVGWAWIFRLLRGGVGRRGECVSAWLLGSDVGTLRDLQTVIRMARCAMCVAVECHATLAHIPTSYYPTQIRHERRPAHALRLYPNTLTLPFPTASYARQSTPYPENVTHPHSTPSNQTASSPPFPHHHAPSAPPIA